jgi:hypothetical protein
MAIEDKTPTFNWTEDEKALLRKTLRVRVLEETRLEVETYGDYGRFVRNVVCVHLGGFLLFGPLEWFSARIVPEGLRVSPLLLVVLLGLIPIASLFMTHFLLPRKAAARLSLFPGTPWCIWHGSHQDSLEMLQPASADSLRRMTGFPVLPFGEDFHGLSLHTRIAASDNAKLRCRDIILDRCNVLNPADLSPPPRIAKLVDEELVRIPLELSRALRLYLDPLSLTANRLVLRGGHSSMIWMGLVSIIDSVPSIAPIWFGERTVLWANVSSPRLWQIVFIAIPWIIATAQTTLFARYYLSKRKGIVTFTKQADHIIWQDRGREVRLPISECRVAIKCDPWESSDNDFSSLFLHHRNKVVARWVLKNPEPLEAKAKAIEAKVREYIAGSDKPESR